MCSGIKCHSIQECFSTYKFKSLDGFNTTNINKFITLTLIQQAYVLGDSHTLSGSAQYTAPQDTTPRTQPVRVLIGVDYQMVAPLCCDHWCL